MSASANQGKDKTVRLALQALSCSYLLLSEETFDSLLDIVTVSSPRSQEM